MIPDITNNISLIDPITLDEMDSVKLMDRSDTKFLFHPAQLPSVLDQAREFYKILDINGKRINRYETLYFDSPEFMLYRQHQNGKLNRYKVRFREYMDSGKFYFEIKFKSNKNKTIKERIKRKGLETTIEGKASEFLKKISGMEAGSLCTNVRINYSRMTLVNKTCNERLTMDLNLRYRNAMQPDAGISDTFRNIDNFVIAEIKQEKFTCSNPFFAIMKKHGIRMARFSKYCAGVNILFPEVKYNRFKERLMNMKKVQEYVN